MKLDFLDKLMGKKPEKGNAVLSPDHSGYAMEQQSSLLKEQRYVNYATDLFSRGYTEAQVIDALKREGLSFDEIDRVVNAALKEKVSGEPSTPPLEDNFVQSGEAPKAYDPVNYGNYGYVFQENSEDDITPIGQGTGNVLASESSELLTLDEIESLIETAIEEKMKEMNELINNLADKIEELERRINVISASVEDEISKSKENLETISGDMRELKDTISKLEPRLNSLEKAFKDIIPNLVDSVREVKELVHEFESRIKRVNMEVDDTLLVESRKNKTK